MYKSKLQEWCQRRNWELPEYTTVKDGPDHMPGFTATVNVHGQIFETPAQCRSAKDAQNTAARIAFDHFNVPPPARVQRLPSPTTAPPTPLPALNSQFQPAPPPEMKPVAGVPPLLPLSPLPSSLPTPPPEQNRKSAAYTSGCLNRARRRLLATKNDANLKPADGDVVLQNHEDTTQTSTLYRIAVGSHEKNYKDTLHMYKNRLQQYAQKHNLGFPVYTCEAEGPPHARSFKSRVSFDGKSYETLEFFPTLKEAEQAAAKVACQVVSMDVIQEDGGLYKNLLQEFAQKKGLLCPSYDTVSSGLSHKPIFVSTVEIGSNTFRGAEAKTKKQAEMNAAKVAYYALSESCPATKTSNVSSVSEYAVADNLVQNIQPTAMTKKHQDAADEEAEIHAKRAKSSPENVNVNAHVPGPLHSNSPSGDSSLLAHQVENSTSAERVTEKPNENRPSIHTKTVVMPRNSRMAIPECASVMPYSDEQWVAYKVELQEEPTA